MAAHLLALVLAAGLWRLGGAPAAVLPAMLLPLLEGGWAVLRPQVGHSPMRIGLRQLVVSAAAMLIMALGTFQATDPVP
jgi:hypothetical protein